MWIHSREGCSTEGGGASVDTVGRAAQLKGEGLVWIHSREGCSAEGGGASVDIQ